jgi:hypothetical protein
MKMICTIKRKSIRLQYICFFTLLLFLASIAFAQGRSISKKARLYEGFRNLAKEMEEAYDNGDLKRVIDLYKENCLKEKNADPGEEKREFKKVNKEIRANIYQRVALAYTELDQPEKGDIFIRRLLVLRRREGTGEYWLSIRNSAKDKYYVAPRLLVGVKSGMNFTIAAPLTSYSIFEPAYATGENHNEKKYDFHFNHSRGAQLGIIIEYALSKRISIYLQPTFNTLKFQYIESLHSQHIVQSSETNINAINMDATSRQTLYYIEMPLFLKYRLGRAKLTPYVQIGAFLSTRTSARKTIAAKITEVIGQYTGSGTNLVEEISIKNHINRSTRGFCLGAGFDYDAGNLRLGIEINYKHILGNIVNKFNRYDKDIALGYYDMLDDIALRNFELSLKVLLPITFKAFEK